MSVGWSFGLVNATTSQGLEVALVLKVTNENRRDFQKVRSEKSIGKLQKQYPDWVSNRQLDIWDTNRCLFNLSKSWVCKAIRFELAQVILAFRSLYYDSGSDFAAC